MRRLSLVIPFFIVILFFSGMFLYKNDTELTSEEKEFLHNNSNIVFVSQSNYPPLEFLAENLESSGMMIELIRWISTEFGFQAKFINTTFANAQSMVQKGDADVLTSFFYSQERDKTFDFTNTVFKIPASIFVRNDTDNIKSLEHLNGKTVAIQKGDYAIDYLKKMGIRYNLVETDDFLSATTQLLRKNVDAILGDEQIVVYYLHKYSMVGELEIVGEPLYVGLDSMATKEGNTILVSILNKGIRLARKNGTLDSIERKWLGYESKQNSLYLIKKLFPLVLVFLFSYILLWFWNIFLKRKVRQKTISLSERIEELRITSEKLNAIFTSSPDGIGMYSLDGKLIFASDKLAEMYGFDVSEKDAGLGVNIVNFIHKDFRDKAISAIHKLVKNKKEKHLSEYLALKKDGTPFWIEVSSSALVNSQGEVDSILFIERDITERKVVEQEIQNKNNSLKQAYENAKYLKEKADKANELKSKFLAIISHELRTPLNAIIGISELINANGKFTHEYINTLTSSSELLNVLLNDLTDLNKIEMDSLELVNRQFSISALTKTITGIIEFRSTKKNLNFILETNFDEDIYLYGDAGRLKQVLLNLLTNAVKYTEKGYVKLIIEKAGEKPDSLQIRFTVEDTGIGISKEDIDKIFLPFFQVDTSHSKKNYGSGIGLYLSKTLVKLMGGDIAVNSNPGSGSKFYFEVNFQKSLNAQSPIKEHDSQLPQLKVLIVEDTTTNLMILTEIIKRTGLLPDAAADGQTAVEKARLNHYDIIFMDLQMPGMDGFETTVKIREFDKDTKIIAVSANVYEEDFRKSVKCGMDDFCPKPISLESIKNIIHKYSGTERKFKLLDFEKLSQDLNNNETVVKALEMFTEETSSQIKKLGLLIKDSAFEPANQTLHKIKGASLTIQAEKMAHFATKFYRDFYSIPPADLGEHTRRLESIFDETKAEIQNYIQSIGTKA